MKATITMPSEPKAFALRLKTKLVKLNLKNGCRVIVYKHLICTVTATVNIEHTLLKNIENEP